MTRKPTSESSIFVANFLGWIPLDWLKQVPIFRSIWIQSMKKTTRNPPKTSDSWSENLLKGLEGSRWRNSRVSMDGFNLVGTSFWYILGWFFVTWVQKCKLYTEAISPKPVESGSNDAYIIWNSVYLGFKLFWAQPPALTTSRTYSDLGMWLCFPESWMDANISKQSTLLSMIKQMDWV